MTRAVLLIAIISAVSVVSAQDRTSVASAPAFEVASIKLNTNGGSTSFYRVPPQGLVTITNGDLQRIVARAYGIDAALERLAMRGGPRDLLAMRFDITAKPSDNAVPGQQLAMLQVLLAERFKLRVHRETREVPIYALVASGRAATDLRASTHNCRAPRAPDVPRPRDAQNRQLCTSEIFRSSTLTNPGGLGLIVGQTARAAGPMSQLVLDIQPYLDRPVVDATGLLGNFEWQLTTAMSGVTTGEYPSIFTAVEEQLGLRLESRTGPFEVLVIDSLERPTPD